MAGFVDSLLIAIGLDTKGVAEGVKEVGAQLDSGLSAAAQSAASKMSPLGEALKNLGKQAKDAKEQVQEIPPALDDAAARVKGVFSGIWGQIIGPLAGAFALGGSISNYIANSIGAGELAEKLKVDVEEIQVWSGAMERAGGSASGLQSTIEKLNASGKAQGDALGVLLDLADKAETMSKEAFYAKAKELEIDEKTIEVLAQGRKALDEHLQRQRELGAYTKEDAENSKKFKQALADLLQAWDSLTSFIGRFAVPVMEQVAKIFTEIVVYLRKHPALVAAAIALVGGALATKLLPPLKALPAIIANVSKAFMRWFPFVAVVMAIAAVFEDFWVYLHGGKSALEDVWKVFGTGPELLAKFRAAWEDLKSVIKTVWEGLKQFASYLGNLAKASGWVDGLKNALKGVAQIFKGLFSGNVGDIGKGLGTMLRGLGQMVLGSLRSLGSIIKDLVKGWFSFDGEGITLSGVVSAIWKAITTAFTNIGKFIASFWEGAFDIELPSLDELGTKIWNAITQIFADLKKKVTDFFKNIFSDIELPSIGDILGGAGDLAKGAAGAAGDLAKGAGDLLGKGLDLGKEGAAKVGEWFSDLFGDAKDGAAKLGAKLGPMLSEGIEEARTRLGKAGDLLGDLIGAGADGAAKIGEKLGPMLKDGLDIAKGALDKAGDFFGGLFSDAQAATADAGAKIEDGMGQAAGAVRDGFNAAWSATRDFAVTQFQGAAVTIQGIFAGIVSGIETQVGALVAGAQAMVQGGGMVPGTAVRAQAAGGRGGGTVIHQSNRVNIDARGGDPKKVQEGVQRGINPGRTARASASGTVQK